MSNFFQTNLESLKFRATIDRYCKNNRIDRKQEMHVREVKLNTPSLSCRSFLFQGSSLRMELTFLSLFFQK